jgi:hypothetical protein
MTPHDVTCKTRGQDGIAYSFPVGLFHPLQHAGLSRRSAYYRLFGSYVLFTPRRRGGASIHPRPTRPSKMLSMCSNKPKSPAEEKAAIHTGQIDELLKDPRVGSATS